ncbi:hypothetical protein AMR42_12855 [Limnothrix sp. PR1529]|nr:hypothetical protein BCR12_11175 [Limnothrix sp. P13C2]PIB09247.1 hypothetical protein AMR42_12855 [Limnothrix sp. PR1529]
MRSIVLLFYLREQTNLMTHRLLAPTPKPLLSQMTLGQTFRCAQNLALPTALPLTQQSIIVLGLMLGKVLITIGPAILQVLLCQELLLFLINVIFRRLDNAHKIKNATKVLAINA